MSYPKVYGVSRDKNNDLCLSVSFARKPTDDELREFHDLIHENDETAQTKFLTDLVQSGIRKDN